MSMRMMSRLTVALAALAVLLLWSGSAQAAPRSFGSVFYNGGTLRAFGVPSPLPHGGTDPFFAVEGGVPGQLGITQYGPGDQEFSGGDWAVYRVTWNTTPYLLTSYSAVAAAQAAGDVTVTREPWRDFRCPIFP